MKRVNYLVTDAQEARLRALAKESGMTMSDWVRRFIDDGLDRAERKQARIRKAVFTREPAPERLEDV